MPSSSYESLTIRALKALFPGIQWQERVRPDFLRYTTGRNLELDLYHEPFRVAIEVQGPHHFSSVDGLATPQKSQAQQDRDTFKRLRCAEIGIKLYTVSIFDLSSERLYRLYCELLRDLHIKSLPMPRMLFERLPDVQAVVREADRLSRRRVRPYGQKRRPYRKPGFCPLIRRIFA